MNDDEVTPLTVLTPPLFYLRFKEECISKTQGAFITTIVLNLTLSFILNFTVDTFIDWIEYTRESEDGARL